MTDDAVIRTEAELREQALADPDVPEPVRRFLAAGARLEAIRLDARGTWWHQGAAFENARLSELFHRSLERTPRGTWLLRIGRYAYPVVVDGYGAFVTALRPADAPTEAHLADGRVVPLEPARLSTNGEDVATLAVDGCEARLVGQAWQAFAERIDAEGERWVYVTPEGTRVPLQTQA